MTIIYKAPTESIQSMKILSQMFFSEIGKTKTKIHIESQGTPNNQNGLEKQGQSFGGFILPDFKTNRKL